MVSSNVIAIFGTLLLFTLVFGMSATVDVPSILIQIKNHRAILTGMICQFLITPFLGYIAVKALSLPYEQGLMLIVITSSPGGSYSNWWCSLFNADLALSVTMTAVSTILSLAFLPMNLLIYTKLSYNADVLSNLDWKSLFVSLFIVLSAISAGLYCSYTIHSRQFNQIANTIGNLSGLTLIIMSATMANTGGGEDAADANNIWNQHWTFYVGALIPCLGALAISTIFASFVGLHKPECVTVGIEACYQNVGIATSLALTMFDDPIQIREAMGIPFFYGVLEAISVGMYCLIMWKINWTKAPANTPIWQVLFLSYEVIEAAHKDEINAIEINISESGDSDINDKSAMMEHHEGSVLTTYFAWLDPSMKQQHHQEPNKEQQMTSSYTSPKLGRGEV